MHPVCYKEKLPLKLYILYYHLHNYIYIQLFLKNTEKIQYIDYIKRFEVVTEVSIHL